MTQEMYKCSSYYEDGKTLSCTCGKCGTAMNQPKKWEEKINDYDYWKETGIYNIYGAEYNVDENKLIKFIKQVESQARLSEREELRKKIEEYKGTKGTSIFQEWLLSLLSDNK